MRILFVCALAGLCLGAQKYVNLRGEVAGLPGPGDQYYVELRPLMPAGPMLREMLAPDGSFEAREIEVGAYEVSVVELRGHALKREVVHVSDMNNRITLRLMPRPAQAPGDGQVSLRRLSYRPPKEAKKELQKAQSDSAKGRLPEAVARIRRAIEIAPDYAEAHNNLGVLYYRLGRPADAAASFERSLQLDPGVPAVSSNYAAALIPLGRAAEAEAIARRALRMDGGAPRTQYVLALAIAAQGKRLDEARTLLEPLEDTFPTAKALLFRLRQ